VISPAGFTGETPAGLSRGANSPIVIPKSHASARMIKRKVKRDISPRWLEGLLSSRGDRSASEPGWTGLADVLAPNQLQMPVRPVECLQIHSKGTSIAREQWFRPIAWGNPASLVARRGFLFSSRYRLREEADQLV